MLIMNIIGVNAKLPRHMSSKTQMWQKSHQKKKRSSFVEGPSRVCETHHPYHPNTNTKTGTLFSSFLFFSFMFLLCFLIIVFTILVVTIPGAMFLSLVFDERCSTASEGDYLQVYEDLDSKEPLFTEKYYF